MRNRNYFELYDSGFSLLVLINECTMIESTPFWLSVYYKFEKKNLIRATRNGILFPTQDTLKTLVYSKEDPPD